ncbi:hypothetical protein B0H67DRAFT_685638 [Lasiosphaeris hirsuta]|uniref:Uncharacterized protein n=1 Tax=Lasiosphaeris hirsuta TaxID=260670 RepID=A0AA40A118_9PEZI|nr:hypothetical protein B0H67DRAFT_685638 [Lasiosphaeris hirsuta]
MCTLDFVRINDIYREANNYAVSERSEQAIAADAGRICIACMALALAQGNANSRTAAYGYCSGACANMAFDSVRDHTEQYWLLAGIGAYVAGNYIYDVWMNFYW